MAKEFWLNLPVKDIKKSKEFFTQLGFTFNNGPFLSETLPPTCLLSSSFFTTTHIIQSFQKPEPPGRIAPQYYRYQNEHLQASGLPVEL